jgi:hypothetical protein
MTETLIKTISTGNCNFKKKNPFFFFNPDKMPQQKLKQNILIRLAPTSLVARIDSSPGWGKKRKLLVSSGADCLQKPLFGQKFEATHPFLEA